MTVLLNKQGKLSYGSRFLRDVKRLGATDAWDFVDARWLRAGRVISAPGLTVTRASSGYAETADGTLVNFGSGVLRRTDRGVLVEGARTNLLLRSQEFDNAAWAKITGTVATVTVAANAIAAPDGTLTADEVANIAVTANHVVWQQLTGQTASASYALSVYVKKGTVRYVALGQYNGLSINTCGAGFDLDATPPSVTGTGANGAGYSASGASVTDAGNGWYRLQVICVTPATTNFSAFFHRNTAYTSGHVPQNYTGATSEVTYLWGFQVEAASFPSSYIPTVASTVTRAADEVTASLSGVAYPLSLYAEFVRSVDTGATEGVLQVDASSRAQRANLNVSSSDTLSVTARGGTDDGDAAVTGAISVGAITKGAGRIEVDNVQAARAGSLATADTTASVPTASPDTVRFGDFSSTATYGFNYIRRAAIFNAGLSDAQLQAITGP